MAPMNAFRTLRNDCTDDKIECDGRGHDVRHFWVKDGTPGSYLRAKGIIAARRNPAGSDVRVQIPSRCGYEITAE